MPKRIGLIIGQLTTGGAEGQLYELVRRIDRARFDPFVYSLTGMGGVMRERIEATGTPVCVIGTVGPARARRLAAALREDRVALVHAWLFIANTYAGLAGGFARRWPMITSARNCKSQGVVHHLCNIAAFRVSAGIIANSFQVRDYIVRTYRAPARRVHVVHNGVDTQRFESARRNGNGAPLIVGAGRLVAQKNFALFLDAAARLRRELPQVRFCIAGEGPQRPELTQRIRALQLGDAVQLLGERADLDAVFRSADVFWLTSSWEGLPNVVLEAMASGLPVVATDVGGSRELVRSGTEGFLIRANDPEELAYYGGALVRDGSLRASMAAAARQRARQFSLPRMIGAIEAVYDHVLTDVA